MTIRTALLWLTGLFLLAACSQPEPTPAVVQTSTPTSLERPPVTVEPKPSQDLFLRPTVVTRIVTDELPDEEEEATWCLDPSSENVPDATWDEKADSLEAAELASYLGQMGVAAICLPPEVGTPFLEAQRDAAQNPPTAEVGRYLQVAFDGATGLALVYASYDFADGPDFVAHANRADYEALKAGTHERAIVTNGTPGFLFIDNSRGLAEKAYVYPFEKHYVAVTYTFGQNADGDQRAELEQAIVHPPYPTALARELNALDEIMASLRLIELTPPSFTAQSK